MKSLAGKVVVITGAGSGLGRGFAQAFAEAGSRLVLADVDAESLEESLAGLGDAEAIAVPTDVAKPAEVDALAARALEAFGAVHVLCNNAGVGCTGFIWEHPASDWDWVLGVNVLGVVNGLRSFVPILLAQDEESHVVNTSSMLGLHGAPLSGPYVASKHAVLAISECLRMDLQLNPSARIGVSVLCPGPVNTRIAEERTRPPRPEADDPEPVKAYGKVMEGVIAAGMAPREVGAKVVEAVLDGRFFVFPAPEYIDGAKARLEEIERSRP